MSVIDDYFQNIDPEKRKELDRIRQLAKKIVPNAEETIGYGMPTFRTVLFSDCLLFRVF